MRLDRAPVCGGWPVSMEPNLFKYIWQHSRAEQVSILLLVLCSLPFYFVVLEVPKNIINRGIQGGMLYGRARSCRGYR